MDKLRIELSTYNCPTCSGQFAAHSLHSCNTNGQGDLHQMLRLLYSMGKGVEAENYLYHQTAVLEPKTVCASPASETAVAEAELLTQKESERNRRKDKPAKVASLQTAHSTSSTCSLTSLLSNNGGSTTSGLGSKSGCSASTTDMGDSSSTSPCSSSSPDQRAASIAQDCQCTTCQGSAAAIEASMTHVYGRPRVNYLAPISTIQSPYSWANPLNPLLPIDKPNLGAQRHMMLNSLFWQTTPAAPDEAPAGSLAALQRDEAAWVLEQARERERMMLQMTEAQYDAYLEAKRVHEKERLEEHWRQLESDIGFENNDFFRG